MIQTFPAIAAAVAEQRRQTMMAEAGSYRPAPATVSRLAPLATGRLMGTLWKVLAAAFTCALIAAPIAACGPYTQAGCGSSSNGACPSGPDIHYLHEDPETGYKP
jgi:hypothetical protein